MFPYHYKCSACACVCIHVVSCRFLSSFALFSSGALSVLSYCGAGVVPPPFLPACLSVYTDLHTHLHLHCIYMYIYVYKQRPMYIQTPTALRVRRNLDQQIGDIFAWCTVVLDVCVPLRVFDAQLGDSWKNHIAHLSARLGSLSVTTTPLRTWRGLS